MGGFRPPHFVKPPSSQPKVCGRFVELELSGPVEILSGQTGTFDQAANRDPQDDRFFDDREQLRDRAEIPRSDTSRDALALSASDRGYMESAR